MKKLLNYKNRIVYFSIFGILMLIGVSYAIWQFSFVQNNPNLAASACFDLSFEEANDISLVNAYPMTDEEGKNLTPYTFTIKNKCSEYASYQVNLEVLNNSTLSSEYVKSEFNNNVKLVSSYPTTAKTLNNASTAYKLLSGYLNPNESITYNLKLWIDYNSTTEQSANKTYESKITIASTYKGTNPSELEECIKNYGENSLACTIMAQADPENSKCLKTNADGLILGYDTMMSDEETPIVCAMEDDYGTSYYLRGNHQNNNVIFANSCWKILRVTGDSGVKLLYNGDLDQNGKCTKQSGTHKGFKGTFLTLKSNYVFASSYSVNGNSFQLNDPVNLNWDNNKDEIIGKYTCGSNQSSCSMIYYVVGTTDSNSAYAVQLNVNVNYASIGSGNYRYSSLSHAGYMYDDVLNHQYMSLTRSKTISSEAKSDTSNYYYGDTISYLDGYYYITNQDGSNVEQLSWANNYQNNLVGKYTCRGTNKKNDTTISCSTAYKVLDTTTKEGYMISEYLKDGELEIGNIKIASSFSENNGNYTLVNPIEISVLDWYSDYNNYKNYYVCEDYKQISCNHLYMIYSTSSNSLYNQIDVSNNFYYGESFTYDESKNPPYQLVNTVQLWNIGSLNSKKPLNTRHYTCFNKNDNTCEKMYFIYDFNGTSPRYVELEGEETIEDILAKSVSEDDINQKNSTIKQLLDYWYSIELKDTVYEDNIMDTVFCNDRTISNYAGWKENGNLADTSLDFNAGHNKLYLKCPARRDAFTVNSSNAMNGSLSYPVGLITSTELTLLGNYTARKTGGIYWTMTPLYWASNQVMTMRSVNSDGTDTYSAGFNLGIRSVIALKPSAKLVDGKDGTISNPYEIE